MGDLVAFDDRQRKTKSRNLSLLQRLNIAIDVAFAIYLHNHSAHPIIHCDF